MKINIARLRKELGAREDFAFIWKERFDLGEAFLTKPVQVQGYVVNTGGNILSLFMSISTEVALACSRCLDQVIVPLDLTVTDQYCHEEDRPQFFADEEEDAATVFFFKEDSLDLQQAIRENLLLGLPMRVLCTPDCPGLCPSCGQNLKEGSCNCRKREIDPRFEVLAEWKKKLKS